MQTKLTPIFQLRIIGLAKANPKHYSQNAKQIHLSSLAAQDYVLSGMFVHEFARNFKNFRSAPGYISIHKKYNLPYKPNIDFLQKNDINDGLVMDLAWSFDQDRLFDIIDSQGNIIAPNKILNSETLHVYHNLADSGIPANGLQTIPENTLRTIISKLQHTR